MGDIFTAASSCLVTAVEGDTFHAFFERAPTPMWLLDGATLRFVAVNEAAVRAHGYPPDDLLTMSVFDVCMVGGLPFGSELGANVGDAPLHVSGRVRHKTNGFSEVDMSARALRYRGRKCWFVVLQLRREPNGAVPRTNVTCRPPAEVPKEAATRFGPIEFVTEDCRLPTLVRNLYDGVGIFGADGEILYASDAVERIFGVPLDALRTSSDRLKLVHPADLRIALEQRKTLSELPGERISRTLRIRHGDGTWHWIECTCVNLFHDPAFKGILTNFRDITERVDAERDRDHFFHCSVAMLCIMTFDGYFHRVNPAWPATLGWSEEELCARPCLDFVHEDDRESTRREAADLLSGKNTFGFENRYRCKDGSYRSLQWSARGVPEKNFIYASALDVTQLKGLEEQVRHAQKSEALGRLASGIAHDVNNMLSVVFGSTELMLETLDATDAMRVELEEIQAVARRSATLMRQLLAFGRSEAFAPRPLNINETIRGVDQLLRRLLGENIVFDVRPNSEHPEVWAEPSQMEQVLVNLAVNARDAMPDGGRFTVETQDATLGESEAARSGLPVGDYVALAVRDSGSGISDAVLPKVFDPFFTTKPPGKGTGLGLSIVFGIVKQSGGAILVESAEGEGTTFKIFLPRATADERPLRTESHVSVRPGQSEHVMVVEDDPYVLSNIARQLRERGYRVSEARDGTEAVEVSRRHDALDLILMDIVMPGMNGFETAAQVQTLHPGARVLFMSGYADHGSMARSAFAARPDFLAKPFTAAQLATKMSAVLDA